MHRSQKIENLLFPFIAFFILFSHQLTCIDNAFAEEEKTFSEQIQDSFFTDANITLGIGYRSLDVSVIIEDTDQKGVFYDPGPAIYFIYSGKTKYFGNSNFGYSWMFDISTFKMNKQEVDNGDEIVEVDLGTSADGYFAYLVPMIFYNIGDKQAGSYLRVGLGLGISTIKIDGDIIITENTTTNERIEVKSSFSDGDIALNGFIEARKSSFVFKLSFASPTVYTDDLIIDVFDFNLMAGWTHYF